MEVEPEELEEGDRVLFNDRSIPLTVEAVEDDRVVVEGPHGGEYEIYAAEDTDDLLVSRKGNRRYSSYCRDLRKTGKWERNGDRWEHSKTGAELRLEKMETGFWTVATDDFSREELDPPRYGYSRKEFAEEDAEKFVEKHPEG
ncbi:MAG: hypothetical protein ABEJ69_03570 [Candidatus Nanohaloarchaea archaeon]